MNAQQLRNSILQEAIEGRLVPQDPNDEPASALLERIREEKKRLVKEGKLKKKDLEEAPISEDEKPFEIPDSWEWVRFSNVACFFNGDRSKNYPNKNEYVSQGIAWINTGHIEPNGFLTTTRMNYITEEKYNSLSSGKIEKGDLVYCLRGATYGKVAKVDPYKKGAVASSLMIIRLLNIDIRDYIFTYLNSPFSKDQLLKFANGAAQPNLAAKDVSNYLLPLPPLAEQKRIVAKIEELLPKVEEYGKAQDALNKLNEELPEKLKKSVLQEAIEGRLVPQDPNDEPASAMLNRIREEKKQLVKAGKLKRKDLEETPISEDEKPFEIPESWEWVRLGEITYNHGQKKTSETFSYIDIGSIDNKKQKLNQVENIIEAKDAPSRARKIVESGDILYSTVRPYLHNMCIIDRNFTKEPIASTGFAVLSCTNGIYNYFLFYYLLSPIFDSYANDGDNAKGVAYPAINDEKLYKGVVPLPPLAEQKRIVAKIEEVFAEIDKLKP